VRTDWVQKVVKLPHKPRGCHIVTRDLTVPELAKFKVGTANLFMMHTSASLTINENASPDVPLDLNDALDTIVPEGTHYRHLDEGPDDMPAHVKSSMMGCSLTVPINDGRFVLGIWQGIYLNEHRNYGGSRSVCITVQGMRNDED
jgi:secondary thiamine-phosphate synthase enzyme